MARYGLWVPISQQVSGTIKWATGRNNRRLTAVVIHRMEGSLEGSDSYLRRAFADYYPYPRLNASTHFGVGEWYGVPQIRQWVDTANTAWGWSARPTDVPTLVARNTLTNLYSGSEDLNWQVISVEVEGFASRPWSYATKLKVIELLKWIHRTHGNLVVMGHTDISSKVCPGMSTFNNALPGYYGKRLGTIFGTSPIPTPIPIPPAPSDIRVGGFPVKFIPRYGWKATLINGKPRRSGASTAATSYGPSPGDQNFPIFVEVVGQNFGSGSRWFVGPQYISGAWRLVYVPYIDLKNRNF